MPAARQGPALAGGALAHLPRAERERIYRRRRLAALGVLGVVFLFFLWAIGSCGEDGSGPDAAKPPELPRGGRQILPAHRVVAYYGAPQDPQLGVLGIGDPAEAVR